MTSRLHHYNSTSRDRSMRFFQDLGQSLSHVSRCLVGKPKKNNAGIGFTERRHNVSKIKITSKYDSPLLRRESNDLFVRRTLKTNVGAMDYVMPLFLEPPDQRLRDTHVGQELHGLSRRRVHLFRGKPCYIL